MSNSERDDVAADEDPKECECLSSSPTSADKVASSSRSSSPASLSRQEAIPSPGAPMKSAAAEGYAKVCASRSQALWPSTALVAAADNQRLLLARISTALPSSAAVERKPPTHEDWAPPFFSSIEIVVAPAAAATVATAVPPAAAARVAAAVAAPRVAATVAVGADEALNLRLNLRLRLWTLTTTVAHRPCAGAAATQHRWRPTSRKRRAAWRSQGPSATGRDGAVSHAAVAVSPRDLAQRVRPPPSCGHSQHGPR
eukprot:CAMPEP_0117623092 /NCGR_PEP_ID=MMETSP0784-20121206/88473_1 /TAXON_ID=39447 /ORGANISM="" /LENGTH=255 /DNA_ID=CAMNT_0005427041 /DNA_START=17 /DNA_END=782 /DNA_ORIENTATION=-